MKCKKCGANLSIKNGGFFCETCDNNLFEKAIFQNKITDFKIQGGILVSYLGNEKDIVIPNGVISIGSQAFKNNLLMQSITFSDTVIYIENNAFEGCVNLRRMYNYDNISHYGDEAFKFSGLTYVSINNRVEHIGKNCFCKMPNLEVVSYMPEKNLKLKYTFAHCENLKEVEMDKFYFFPSLRSSLEVRNNPNNKRPTWGDVFVGTPYIKMIFSKYVKSYKDGVCPECGGKISKSIFHARCKNCKIDYKN